jgi:hypothetical protein
MTQHERQPETNLKTRERLKANGKRGRRKACDVIELDDARHQILKSMARPIAYAKKANGRHINLGPNEIAVPYKYLADKWECSNKNAEATIQRLLKRGRISLVRQSYGRNVNVYNVKGNAPLRQSSAQKAAHRRTVENARKYRGSSTVESAQQNAGSTTQKYGRLVCPTSLIITPQINPLALSRAHPHARITLQEETEASLSSVLTAKETLGPSNDQRPAWQVPPEDQAEQLGLL